VEILGKNPSVAEAAVDGFALDTTTEYRSSNLMGATTSLLPPLPSQSAEQIFLGSQQQLEHSVKRRHFSRPNQFIRLLAKVGFFDFLCHHFTAFKYLLIACRTTSPRETRFRLAAAFSAFICFRSIRAINRVSFIALTYRMDMYMSSHDLS
jgi:hypothetical protein